jgi:hypothetical protein
MGLAFGPDSYSARYQKPGLGYYLAHAEPPVLVSAISALALLCSRNLAVVIPC